MGKSYRERVADDSDPLRGLLEAARSWRVPPTVFIQQRTVNTAEWTEDDTLLALALEDYEAGLCPGGRHQLSETTKDEHADAYRPGERVRCHYCVAAAKLQEVQSKDEDSVGLLVPIVLDAEVVKRNLLPVPAMPTPEELQQRQAADDERRRQAS